MMAYVRRATSITAAIAKSYRPKPRSKPHGLPGELIVSLTSYPPRFRTLARTLRCLTKQTVKPDRVILWIAEGDIGQLPAKVLNFENVTVRTCPDYRSLKKLVPALNAYPNAYIATADDDLFYPADWLQRLVTDPAKDIKAMNVMAPRWDGTSYSRHTEWPIQTPAPYLIAGTGAGALFPPRSLHPDVSDFEAFNRLSPSCDDSWIAWQAARAGSAIVKVENSLDFYIPWEGTTSQSLSVVNLGADCKGGVHHTLIENLTREYGPLHAVRR